MLKASVIVSTYKRPHRLRGVLAGLKIQSLSPDVFEVIVCDTYNGDETKALVGAFVKAVPGARYIDVANNSPAAKRNAGILNASCDIVILLDDDVVPSVSCIEEHLYIHASAAARVVACGQVRYPKELVRASNYCRFRDSRHPGPTKRQFVDKQRMAPHMMVTMNCSFRRSVVAEKAGYLSEEFAHYGGEDIEFGYRLKENGIGLIYSERALAYHFDDGGSIRRYMAKLYCASRYSAPIVMRLAPEFGADTKYRWIEQSAVSSSWLTTYSCSTMVKECSKI